MTPYAEREPQRPARTEQGIEFLVAPTEAAGDKKLVERLKTDAVGEDGRPIYQQRELVEFRDVIRTRSAPWSSNHDMATGQEAELLQGFFDELINAIADIAPDRLAPIHFYVWSRAEMSQLIEACLRSDTRLLRSLQELMGCREPLDQLIFSCVGEEADKQLAFGWTGRGLSVLTSLRWYGERFHWTRTINRAPVQLDWVFRQDLFDFKTRLELRPDNEWARDRDLDKVAYPFEIRSRFFDSLSAPYWRAVWGSLPSPETAEDAQQRGQLERYYEAAQPNYLRGLLLARLHAMRWVEWFLPRNDEISKPRLDVIALRQFNLGITTPAEAALDFLRLDHHVKVAEWLSMHMVPAAIGNAVPPALAASVAVVLRAQCFDGLQLDARRFVPKESSNCPEAEQVRRVPKAFKGILLDNTPHPGEGKGPGAKTWC